MIRSDGCKLTHSPQADPDDKHIGRGSEVHAYRTRLHYSEYRKTVDGLVQRRFNKSEEDRGKAFREQDVTLRQWKDIQEINRRRKKEGKTTFQIPGTIRGYDTPDEVGILMTDLSQGGSRRTMDLKEVFTSAKYVDVATQRNREQTGMDWQRIRELIEKDIAIAEEEGVELNNGPHPLDPWLVVWNDDEPQVYLLDIGHYSRTDAPERDVSKCSASIRAELDDYEKKYWSKRKEGF